MPLIITATDFSAVAENAANYACSLAVAQDARLTIIHSFVFPVMFSDIPLPTNLINDTESDLETQMKNTVSNLKKSFPQLDIQGIVIDGDLIGALEDYAQKNQEPWLIVLGNNATGEYNAWESTMLAAFKHLKYPVLAVPPGLTYKPVKKICFALDNKHEGNDLAFTQLRDITLALHSELQVLNAQKEATTQNDLPMTDEQAPKILAPANPHFHTIYDSNIDSAIETFISNSGADWLAMIPRKHSFFEGLFHKSHSKTIARHSLIPILALHEAHTEG